MIRRLDINDAEAMLEWMHDVEIQKCFQKEMSNYTRNDVLNFIKEATVEIENGKSIHYAVTDDNDKYLGTISLKNINLQSKNAEYAIALIKSAHGTGVAGYATNELLKKAFTEFGLERVYLNVLSDNIRAIKFYEKCGFSFEGEFRNHLFIRNSYRNLKWYSILKDEFLLHKRRDIITST